MEFRVLGAIEVVVDGHAVEIGHARQRAVLAVLLAEANRVVTVDQLVERVWGGARRPDDPRAALRTYVSLLRRALAGGREVAFPRQPSGYSAEVDERLVDLHRFHDLLGAARAAGDDGRAAVLTQQALDLWRGDPFAGLDTPWINAARQSLLVRRQAARLDLIDLQLRLGRHAALLGELSHLADEDPLDERIAGQLMLALYRSGRQADALAHYQRIRRRLVDEVGADPGSVLGLLHQRILAADPVLTAPAPDAAADRVPPAETPRQLPAAPRLFTGRERELGRLTKTLDEQAGSGATLMISAIGGAGGIGKTWLALHWAHQNADRFPDGQLYANLRGFDPSGEPTSPQTALRGFLDGLGVESSAIPAEPDAQAGLYRSLTAGRHMLVLLDNARDSTQVAPLLPGSPTCTVVVTSRHLLTGLISAHGAYAMDLGVLPSHEARQLLARHLGPERVAAEPDAIAEMLERCAGLPLALSIVAARALSRPDFPLAVLVDELRDASARLDALTTGDLSANVRAVLSWSYDALDSEAARVLGLLALAPGPDIGLPAASSLTALPVGRLRTVLRELEHASLLQQHAPGRYRMHDLVRLYATDHAEQSNDAAERDAALQRVQDFYAHTAYAADRMLAPHRQPIPLDPPAAGTHRPLPLSDDAAAMDWFDTEHANLMATQRGAAALQRHLTVWQLAWALSNFHVRRARSHDELAAWRAALAAAAHLTDVSTLTLAHRLYGRAHVDLGRHDEAIGHLQQALELAVRHHDVAQEAHTHHALSWVLAQQGEYRRALHHATSALGPYRALNQPTWEASSLNNMGLLSARMGDHETGRPHCQEALAIYRRHNDPNGQAAVLDSLGYIDHHTGRHEQAVDHYRQALDLFRGLGDTYETATTLENIGHPHAALGRHDRARAVWREALEMYRDQQRDGDAERVERQLAELPPEAR